MKASPFEFRIRYLLHTIVFALGFWAPWNLVLHIDPTGPNAHLWGILAAWLARITVLNIGQTFDLFLILGILFAFAAAALRTWGSAYLGANIVQDGAMHAGVVADGPYRRLRNPLYLGTFLHTVALALLMPRSGAVFTILLIAFMQVRLVLGEEAFLTQNLGAPYLAYKALVPSFIPALRPLVAASGRTPHWPQAFLGEIYMWGVALAFLVAGWRYNAALLIQSVIVSFGLSLITRAIIPKPVS